MLRKVFVSGLAGSALAAGLLLGAQGAQAADCSGAACYKLVKKPALYRTVSKTYLARPAQTQARIVPAEYGYVTENVLVQPAQTIPHHRPATYSSVSEKVMISPPTQRWEVSRDMFGNTVGCWVEVPAQYGYRQRTVEVSPPTVEYETVAAVYVPRQRQVMLRPTQVVRETIPPVYETVQRQVMVSPGASFWEPARY
ncbi:hypothetical protein DWF00_04540 [Bosea caraganae]|uniref:Uncharacterized protein n=1 Tax=Bosea caraganae TaxID=2763117 RepID=A0A370KZK2_9HYPH|nr:hypothetical protein [Bosea caraganae]RDJ20439.1 hypothetical protein DWE98_24250 [Bosea caraganae]RDJ29954.1 hypothetical protein DWF00_04540 [Bosea caraganae]